MARTPIHPGEILNDELEETGLSGKKLCVGNCKCGPGSEKRANVEPPETTQKGQGENIDTTSALDRAKTAGETGPMDRERVLAKLRAHERQLKDAGIVRLSLFGSTARGDAGPNSDVDLLAAFDNTRRISLLDIVGMELDLAEMLGCKVDLIEEGTLKPRAQKSVEAEVVRAF